MSPEPTQEIMDENLKVPQNVTMELQGVESDSEDDEAGEHGYLPLSQVPTDSDVILDDDDVDDEDDEWISNDNNTNDMIPVPNDDCTTKITPSELTQVWTTPCSIKNCIDLDADKINQVKTAMANFKLPTTAIPEWANSVTEEQWKDKLIDKIKKIQEQ